MSNIAFPKLNNEQELMNYIDALALTTQEQIALYDSLDWTNPAEREIAENGLRRLQPAIEALINGNLGAKRIKPVTIDEFLTDPHLMGAVHEDLWPEVRKTLQDILGGDRYYPEVILTGAIGIAKCLGKDTDVILYDGSVKKVQDVIVGDKLLSPDSKAATVTSVCSGREMLYKIKQGNGNDYVVNESHILSLKYTSTNNNKRGKSTNRYGKQKSDILNISVKDYVALSKSHKSALKGWMPSFVNFNPANKLVAYPYFIGLWLGDGSRDNVVITNPDKEIISYLHEVAEKHDCVIKNYAEKVKDRCPMWSISGAKGDNFFRKLLQQYNLFNNKHIPHEYKTACLQQRLLLLAGILDTDGHLNKNSSTYTISQKSETLANDILFLARSCGFRVNKKVTYVDGIPYYRMNISGNTEVIPCKVARKINYKKRDSEWKNHTVWSIEVEKLEEGDYYGFTLDSDDRLFLLGDFTVTHNTTIATIILAYDLFCLSCEVSPQKQFGLMPTTDITFALLNKTDYLAKSITYSRFRKLVEKIPYFNKEFPFDKRLESVLKFPNNIIMVPAAAYNDKIMGSNIVGGIVDEMNFMDRVQGSKKVQGKDTFDQAVEIYFNIKRRIKSRFYDKSQKMAGHLCVVSSKAYVGDFTEKAIEASERDNDGLTYIFDKAQWDVKPRHLFSDKNFIVELGDERYNSRILVNEYEKRKNSTVIQVPVDFIKDFREDIEGALKDFAGITPKTNKPFFYDREAVWKCSDLFKEKGYNSVYDFTEISVLPKEGIPPREGYKIDNPTKRRVAHIDLGLKRDACGIAIGYIEKLQTTKLIDAATGNSKIVQLPIVVYDMLLRVKPPAGGEIDFEAVRNIIIYLRYTVGIPIKRVTFDNFQSVDSRQLLKKSGFIADYLSVDGTNGVEVYRSFRQGIHGGRVMCDEHEFFFGELLQLKEYPEIKKIDHPPSGSKDVADAAAGVYGSLMQNRASWLATEEDVREASDDRDVIFEQSKFIRVNGVLRRRPNSTRPQSTRK